jgi:glutathione S-transferase
MPKLKLTYSDFHGGRGEPARLALSMGGIWFEDNRVPPSDWQWRKPDTPFGFLPVLEVDGRTLAQSNAVNRYVGKLTDLYPSDAWQAALCDEVMEYHALGLCPSF